MPLCLAGMLISRTWLCAAASADHKSSMQPCRGCCKHGMQSSGPTLSQLPDHSKVTSTLTSSSAGSMLTSKPSAGAAAVLSVPAMEDLLPWLLTHTFGGCCTDHEDCCTLLRLLSSTALQMDGHASLQPSVLGAPCTFDRDCDNHLAVQCCNQAKRLQGISGMPQCALPLTEPRPFSQRRPEGKMKPAALAASALAASAGDMVPAVCTPVAPWSAAAALLLPAQHASPQHLGIQKKGGTLHKHNRGRAQH